ncbi:helix-turn-helix domain-containing protein [Bradyrhizobium japonicum]|uniref:helix-turn-helix domain-containing protein n=1 Tax=Bradyrhizobium japonicum TaxID=375 RepID=UPI000675F76B|nr:helix-turn-helix transcriptional regulator [Bradyrhizobium japonicum]
MRNNYDTCADHIEAQEDLVIDAQFLLHDLMIERGVSRTELARRVGISKARLSQFFNAKANPTLRTLAVLFQALGETVKLERACTPSIQARVEPWIEDAHQKSPEVRALSEKDATQLISSIGRISRIRFAEAEPANDSFPPGMSEYEVAA